MQLIQDAYGLFEDYRFSGQPKWLSSDKYDIEAKVDDTDIARLQKLDLSQHRIMLQRLLADRFKLKIHPESKQLPIYALIVGKNGPRLEDSKHLDGKWSEIEGMGGTVKGSAPHLIVEWHSMHYLAQILTPILDRTVVDETRLSGHYNFKLDWTPDMRPASDDPGPAGAQQPGLLPSTPSGPSIFTAIQEQLGLKLEP